MRTFREIKAFKDAKDIYTRIAERYKRNKEKMRGQYHESPKIDFDEFLHGVRYKKGDFIGDKYEVFAVLTFGGFGVVYLVYSHSDKVVYAFKTFRDEYLKDAGTRERFRKKAQAWIDLGSHPYITRAYLVEEIAGQVFVGMEYAPIDEDFPNSLGGSIAQQTPHLAQGLRWSIQFCHAMEYALSRGVGCHGDIKPGNILIGRDGAIRVTDFGMAEVIAASQAMPRIRLNIPLGRVGLSVKTVGGTHCGTPTHMAPEQFSKSSPGDVRSDIYSFGIVMYQMVAGGRIPFMAPLPADSSGKEAERFWEDMHELHCSSPVPKLKSVLFPVILHCLEKEPDRRYQSFADLRADLESLLRYETDDGFELPSSLELEQLEWSSKGHGLAAIGRFEEAVQYFDKALELGARSESIWYAKGTSLRGMGRFEDAVVCFDEVLEIDPRHEKAWSSKGACLEALDRTDEAARCYDRALQIEPKYADALNNKAWALAGAQRYSQSLRYFDKALQRDPNHVAAWANKGTILDGMGRLEDAIKAYDRALELNPSMASVWYNKGLCLKRLGRNEEALKCYDESLALDPDNAAALNNKGSCLGSLGRFDEASACYEKALKLDPQHAGAWYNKGNSLNRKGRLAEAINCYATSVELDPHQAAALYNKAVAEEKLGRKADAVRSYEKFIAIAPSGEYEMQIHYARQKMKSLK